MSFDGSSSSFLFSGSLAGDEHKRRVLESHAESACGSSEGRPRKRRLCEPDAAARCIRILGPAPVSVYPSPPLSARSSPRQLPVIDATDRCASTPAVIDCARMDIHDELYRTPPSPPPTLQTTTFELPESSSYDTNPLTFGHIYGRPDGTTAPRIREASPLTPISPSSGGALPFAAPLEGVSEENENVFGPHLEEASRPPWSMVHHAPPSGSPLRALHPLRRLRTQTPSPEYASDATPSYHNNYARDSIELRRTDADELLTPLTPAAHDSYALPSTSDLLASLPPAHASLDIDVRPREEDHNCGMLGASGSGLDCMWDTVAENAPMHVDERNAQHDIVPWFDYGLYEEPAASPDRAYSTLSGHHVSAPWISPPHDCVSPEPYNSELGSPCSPWRRGRSASLPELDFGDSDDGSDTHALSSPLLRSSPTLPSLDWDLEMTKSPARSTSPQLLSLPGADTDDDLFSFEQSFATDPEPPPMLGAALGLFVPVAPAQPPAEESAREAEPDLAFAPDACARVDADELARLIALRRRSWFLERNAKRAELEAADEVRTLATELRLSPPVPNALAEYDSDVGVTRLPPASGSGAVRRAIQALEAKRAEARRDRKAHKDRGKELQCLLRFRLGETAAEQAGAGAQPGARRAKTVIKSVPHLVARMVLKRREGGRLLCDRRAAHGRLPSPLSQTSVVGEGAEEDSMDETG